MFDDDPILREIREERARNAEKYGSDIEAMLQGLKRRQRERGANLIQLGPKAARQENVNLSKTAISPPPPKTMEIDDPILREIREGRERNAEKYGGDVRALLRDLKKRQQESGVKTVRFPPKRIEKPADTSP